METLGSYQLERRIAVGGMAEIFLALHQGIGGHTRRVAIKRILPHRADDAEFVEMFLNEARVAALLNHPHIVQIYDVGDEGGTYYIAMEYVPGYDLGQILDRSEELRQPVPPHFVAKLIAQAGAGLHYAHSYKDPSNNQPLHLVHRDVSLPNIMVSLEGVVKILDFGIAKAATNRNKNPTQTGVLKGKISYMSPEYLMGESIDWRHDLFALGVMMYELLTGQKPFKAKGDVQMLQAILTQEPQDPYQFNPSLPRELLDITMKLLSKDRTLRYQHGAEIEYDLEQAAQIITGHEVTQQQLSEYIQQLFRGSAEEVIISNDVPQMRERHLHADQATGDIPAASPSFGGGLSIQNQAPVSQTADLPSFQQDQQFDPFQQQPSAAAPAPAAAGGMSWQEETKCLDAAAISAATGIDPSNYSFDEPARTSALVLGPDGTYQPSALGDLDPDIAQNILSALDNPAHEKSALPAPNEERLQLASAKKPASGGSLAIMFILIFVVIGGGVGFYFYSRPKKPRLLMPIRETPEDLAKTTEPKQTPSKAPKTVGPDNPAGTKAPAPKTLGAKAPTPKTLDTKTPALKTVGPDNPGTKAPPVVAQPVVRPTSATPARSTDNVGGRLILYASSPPCPCTVYWRGRRLGRTPLPIRLPAGTHRMLLRRSRPYVRVNVTLSLRNGQLLKKRVRIREGLLVLNVKPWAKVYLDGNYLGRTPLSAIRLYAGSHTLKLTNNRSSRSRKIYIRGGQRRVLNFRLR